jgi:uncharacterized tellurite resistance protein B-like protein
MKKLSISHTKLNVIKDLHSQCAKRFKQLEDDRNILKKNDATNVDQLDKMYFQMRENLSQITANIRRFVPGDAKHVEDFKLDILAHLEDFDDSLQSLEDCSFDSLGFWSSDIPSFDRRQPLKALYIANIIRVAQADGEISDEESDLLQVIVKEIGGSKEDLSEALHIVRQSGCALQPVGSFADQVRNIEDMLRVCLIDDFMEEHERELILLFASTIGLGQQTIKTIEYWIQQKPNRVLVHPMAEKKPDLQ